MNKVIFKKDYLLYDLNLPSNAIEEKVVDVTRWSIVYEIIFKIEDKFYSTIYSTGATEQQCEGPWEYEDDIECTEVHEVEKIVKVWEPI